MIVSKSAAATQRWPAENRCDGPAAKPRDSLASTGNRLGVGDVRTPWREVLLVEIDITKRVGEIQDPLHGHGAPVRRHCEQCARTASTNKLIE